MVSFIDAAEFCIKLSKQETVKPVYFSANNVITLLPGDGYRLPTEAEWEWACRGGTPTSWSHGEQESGLGTVAWYGTNSGGRTHAVGELKPNPFGLYDTHGNVWEWCQDWHDAQAYSLRGADATEDPQGPDAGLARVLRGGYWLFVASSCRSAFCIASVGGFRFYGNGFRVVVPVDAVRQALKLTGPALPNRPKATVTDGSTASTAKPLTPLPHLDLDETDPSPGWDLPAGAPPPVVAPCQPTLATERQQLWAEFLKRPVIEENNIAEFVRTREHVGKAEDRILTNPATANPATENSATTLKFALIPPGEFRKIFTRPRDPAIEPDMPVRSFRITKPYALSTTEVTWDQFRQFVEATGYQTEAETNGLGGRDREFKPDVKIN